MAELPCVYLTKAYIECQVGRSYNSKVLLSDSDMLWDMATINIHSPEGEGMLAENYGRLHISMPRK